MEQPIHSKRRKKQTKRVKLLDIPIEILVQILIYLENEDLLDASHVCKLFASAAGTAFAQKYSKIFYEIDFMLVRFFEDTKANALSFHKVMVNKYGEKMRMMSINGDEGGLLDLIEQKCCSLIKVELIEVPMIISFKNLKEIRLRQIQNLNSQTFTEFINANDQLEILKLEAIEVDLLHVLNGQLNRLKHLTYVRETSFVTDLPEIRLNSLETLESNLPIANDYARLLQAMHCNPIKELDLWYYSVSFDGVINEICSIKTLRSLQIQNCSITTEQMRKLAKHLPHLTKLRSAMIPSQSNAESSIMSVLSIFPKLTKLSIALNDNDFQRFLIDFKKSMYNFHARFANTNTEIEMIKKHDMMAISKDRVFICDGNSIELHWMENFDERNVRKLLYERRNFRWLHDIKFINNCAESPLNIAALMIDYSVNDTICLDIKSKGPIIVNADVSKMFSSFDFNFIWN